MVLAVVLLAVVLESRQGEKHKNTPRSFWGGNEDIETPFFFGFWGIRTIKGQSEHLQVCPET